MLFYNEVKQINSLPQLTYADISTYDNIYAFSVRGPLLSRPNDDHPFLKELFNNVESNERIKAYLASRKQTDI